MKTPKMLVIDLDGTALVGRDRLADRDIAAAAALNEAGIHVSIATGRLWSGTQWVASRLGLTGSVAIMNGSARRDAVTGAELYDSQLDARTLERFREAVRSNGVAGVLFQADNIHHHAANGHHADYLEIWTPNVVAWPELYEHAVWNGVGPVLAGGAIGTGQAVQAVQDALAGDPDVELVGFDTYQGERFLSVRMASQDKGTALAALASDRGFGAEDVVAVGDWWNDVPMLRTAGLSFAMNGAGPLATEAAHETLDARRGEGGALAEIALRVWDIQV